MLRRLETGLTLKRQLALDWLEPFTQWRACTVLCLEANAPVRKPF